MKPPCPVEGCERPMRSGGYCMVHYLRLRRRGSTGDRPGTEARFWSKVDRTGACWLWTAATHDEGYGRFWDGARLVPAHRWAYLSLVGPIPEGLHLDHLCRTRACVNPAHLEPVTPRENTLRAPVTRARAGQVACVHGHAFTPGNTITKPNGTRKCRECAKARSARLRLAGAS